VWVDVESTPSFGGGGISRSEMGLLQASTRARL
jgi:hypothetical protein